MLRGASELGSKSAAAAARGQGDGGSDGSGRWIGECIRLRVAWLVGGPASDE